MFSLLKKLNSNFTFGYFVSRKLNELTLSSLWVKNLRKKERIKIIFDLQSYSYALELLYCWTPTVLSCVSCPDSPSSTSFSLLSIYLISRYFEKDGNKFGLFFCGWLQELVSVKLRAKTHWYSLIQFVSNGSPLVCFISFQLFFSFLFVNCISSDPCVN